MKPLSILLFPLLFFACYAQSQERCGFDIVHQRRMNTDPVYKAGIDQQKALIREYISKHQNELLNGPTAAFYTIPVVVHVVHTGGAIGSIYNPTTAQIQSTINYLNQVYEGTYPGTEGVGDIQINFALATRDPNCNPTSGINRVDGSGIPNYTAFGVNANNATGVDETTIKNLVGWDPFRYYNIWVVNRIDSKDGTSGSFIAGYAYFPGAPPALDGTIMLATQMNTGRKTLPHEIGHAFGLYHPFEGACPEVGSCALAGDEICDTDPISQPAGFVCRTGPNACAGGTPYSINTEHNYMNYTNCATLFTADQKIRMLAAAAGPFRSGLSTSWAKSATYPILPFTPPIPAACTPVTTTLSNTTGNLNFFIGNRNLTSGSTEDDNGYLNASNGCLNLVQLIQNNTYSFSFNPVSFNFEQVRAWIDYNNNGVFENATEEVFYQDGIGPPSPYNVTVNGSLTVPPTAVANTVLRMRVIEEISTLYGAGYSISSSCYNPFLGQAEDFPVIIASNVALPVSYTSFFGKAEGSDVLLNWKTESESDNDLFLIERAADGRHFSEVGRVKGRNDKRGATYQFLDRQPGIGLMYYRLKQIDIDGSSRYSVIIKVTMADLAKRSVHLVSNLFEQEIRLQFGAGTGDSRTVLRLMDISGRQLLSKEIHTVRSSVETIDLTGIHLNSGMYLLEVIHGTDRWIEKVFKK